MNLFASIYIGSSETILKVFEISKEGGLKEIDCLRSTTDIMKDIYTSDNRRSCNAPS